MTEARRVRIEYDFTVTSKSTTMVDKTTRTQRILQSQSNATAQAVRNLGNAMGSIQHGAKRGEGALKSFSRTASNVTRTMSHLGRSIFSWRTLFLGYFAGSVMGSAKRALIDYNASLDNFRQGIALSLNQMTDWDRSFGGVSNTQDRWNKSMMGANHIMGLLRKQAASSIGSQREYMEGFQMLNSAIQAVGGSAGDTIEVVKRLIPLAKASGRDVMTGVMDITQVLRGDTNLRQINLPVFRDPRVLELAKVAKGVPKQGIQGDPHKAMLGLIQVMSKADPALKSYSETFAAQVETATDNVQMFAAEIGKPIFDRVTKELRIFNSEWGTTQMKLRATGEKIGKYLVDGFDKAKSKIDVVVESMKKLAYHVSVVSSALIGIRVAGGVAGLLSFANTGAARNSISGPGSRYAAARTKLNDPFGFSDVGNISMSGLNLGKMNGVPQSGGGAGNAAAAAALAGSGSGKVSGLRAGFGMAAIGMLGAGAALSFISENAERLAKQEGYMAEMAKKAVSGVSSLKSAIEYLGNASVVAFGYVVKLGEGIGTFLAKAYSYMSNAGKQPTSSGFGADEKNKQQKTVSTLQDIVDAYKKYGTDVFTGAMNATAGNPVLQSIVEMEKRNIRTFSNPAMQQISNALDTGGAAAAFRVASGTAVHTKGGAKFVKPSTGNPILDKWASRAYSGFALDAGVLAAEVQSNPSAQAKIDAAHSLVSAVVSIRQKRTDEFSKRIDKLIAEEFKGQKREKKTEFNFSGSTFNINQDFRNADPDRVAVQFVDDLGKIAATNIQARLTPMLN